MRLSTYPCVSALALTLISSPSAVFVQGRDLCFTKTRDSYPYAVTEWFCSSGSTCCSVRDTGEDAELLWGCIDDGETCSRETYLTSENMGFEVIDDGYGEDGEDNNNDGDDNDDGASGFAASLPAMVGSFIVIGAVLGM